MTLLGLLFLLKFAIKGFCQDDEFDKFMQSSLDQGLQLFSGLDEVLSYFRNNETDPLAHRILKSFEEECFFMAEPQVPVGRNRKPFIVFEGNHRRSRETVGIKLARLMGGRILSHPAPCLAKYLNWIPKQTLLRRAYYMLSLYAQAFNAKVQLSLGRPVIMNGYWWDQLVFHLLQSFPRGRLPNVTSDVFKFPADLYKPDVIYYLDIPDTLRFHSVTTRSPTNWKPRALKLYQDLQARYNIVFFTLTGVPSVTTHAIYKHVHELLWSRRSIWAYRHKRPEDSPSNSTLLT